MTSFLFQSRPRRTKRFGKYNGLPASILYEHSNGQRLIACASQRFTAYPDELIPLAKPLHGSPANWTFNNDGSLRA